MGSEARNSGFCFAHNLVNFGSGTAKLGEVKYEFILFHFIYKLWKIILGSAEKTCSEVRLLCQTGSRDDHWWNENKALC